MATAKRVKQEDRIETVHKPSTAQHFHIVETNGRETSRQPLGGPVTSTFVSQKRTPQPDRIVLEMSVEEAETLRIIVGNIGGIGGRRAHADAIRHALQDAGVRLLSDAGDSGSVFFPDCVILPVSPNAGTQTSPVKDAAGGGALGGYNPSGLYQR